MNDAVLIQQIYPGRGMERLLDLTEGLHRKYCEQHEFDYQVERQNVVAEWSWEGGAWTKVELLHRALLRGYSFVVWLDADAMIVDPEIDLREACRGAGSVGAVKFYAPFTWGDHYNTGALYLENSSTTRKFVDDWLAGYPGPEKQREQGVFNALSEGRVTELPSAWNYTLDRHFGITYPVVRGYHSIRSIEGKYQAMKEDLPYGAE